MKIKDIQMLLIMAVAAVGLGALCVYYLIFSEDLPIIDISQGIEQEEEEYIVTPRATGDVGDIVNALMKELLDEKMLLLEEEEDINLIISDDEEIKEFDQSINEDEL